MALNYVTLVCDLYDGQGSPAVKGTAAFVPTVQLTDTTDHAITTLAPVPGVFRAGSFPQVKLLATDNTAPLPNGWGWTVTFDGVPGSPAGFTFFLPFTGGATQYLSSMVPVSSAVSMQGYLPLPSGTPAAGQVPAVQQNNSTATAWETLTAGLVGADPAGAASTAQASAVAACQPLDLNELLIAPTGAAGETIPRNIATATSGTMSSGTVYTRAIGLRSGVLVSNVTLFNTGSTEVTQASLTHGWYVLCDKNMVVRAVSADQIGAAFFTAFNTGYTLSVAGSAYTTTYTGAYYVGVMVAVSAGSMPGLAVGGNASTGVAQASPVLYGSSSTGQTTPPLAGASLAAVSFLTGFNFYAYVS